MGYKRTFMDMMSLHEAKAIESVPAGTYSSDLTENLTVEVTEDKPYRGNWSLTSSGGTTAFYYTPGTAYSSASYSHIHVSIWPLVSHQPEFGLLVAGNTYIEEAPALNASEWNDVDCWLKGAKYGGTGSAVNASDYATISIEYGSHAFLDNISVFNAETSSEYDRWVELRGSYKLSQTGKVEETGVAGRSGDITQQGRANNMMIDVDCVEAVSASRFVRFLNDHVGNGTLLFNSDMLVTPVTLDSYTMEFESKDVVKCRLRLREYSNV